MKRTILIVALFLSSSANAAIIQFDIGGVINAVAPNPAIVSVSVNDLWSATLLIDTDDNPISNASTNQFANISGTYNLGSFGFNINSTTPNAFMNTFTLSDSIVADSIDVNQQLLEALGQGPLPTIDGIPWSSVGIQLRDRDRNVFSGSSIDQTIGLSIDDFDEGDTGGPLGSVFNMLFFNGPGGTILTGTVTSFNASAAVVPIPAAVWLFGSALVGLLGVTRRKVVV